jgi:hypothetical protein
MSFPEGPTAGENTSPDERSTADTTGGVFGRVLRALHAHVATWAGRYVDMRVAARTDSRK